MKPNGLLRVGKWALGILLVLLLGLFAGFWGPDIPLIDPAPKGEGSFDEAAEISRQFRDFYLTRDANHLPQGHVRLNGLDEKGLDDTWIIYYATASHSMARGGTIVLLDSDGAISTYFGHHCSSVDGGTMIVPGAHFYSGIYEGGIKAVRADFDKTFKHHRTEAAAASDAGRSLE